MFAVYITEHSKVEKNSLVVDSWLSLAAELGNMAIYHPRKVTSLFQEVRKTCTWNTYKR